MKKMLFLTIIFIHYSQFQLTGRLKYAIVQYQMSKGVHSYWGEFAFSLSEGTSLLFFMIH